MEKEKLGEELTEKISGGVGVESNKKIPHGPFESYEINVKCAKCGKEFGYVINEGPVRMKATAYLERKRRKRTCPSCGYVNSAKELGI